MKYITYLVVGLLLISGFAAISIGEEAGEIQNKISVTFFKPNVIEKDTFIELEVKGAETWIFNSGNPLLPVHTETFTLPFGATITNIECEVKDIQTKVLSKKIAPAPQPVPLTNEIKISSEPLMDQEIYDSDQMYPENWFSYNTGGGLDKNMEHKTLLTINTYPIRYNPVQNTIYYTEKIDVTFTYKVPDKNPFKTSGDEHKLVIITSPQLKKYLKELVDFKISKGISTLLVTTTEIYSAYTGYDKPEQIKYFIKDVVENNQTKYVLLFGGLKSFINGNPRENTNEGTKDWHVPVRYSNMVVQTGDDPGYISDVYYADLYFANGSFCSWDSNNDHIYGNNGQKVGITKKDKIDLYPDVAVGRIPCRVAREAKDVVQKIITYESETYNSSWFNKMVLVSGDGFLDQLPWGIKWNTNSLPNGEYTIYGQSKNIDNVSGPIDEVHVTIDKTKPTSLHFNHDDHLTTGLNYPFPPVTEIVTVSDGDILGNTDYSYDPTEKEAYLNGQLGWANLQFKNGILNISGKTYDPRPYGVITDLHVWINNSAGTKIGELTIPGFMMFWEGEWCTGEEPLLGRAGGAYYMPSTFEKNFIWTSNGKFTSQQDVIDTLSQGCGFVFFSGHGSPAVWADHYPGVPGNRKNGSVYGLKVIDIQLPLFPMSKLKNDFKNPVIVVGGCHNSQFNVSFIQTLLDKNNSKYMNSYGIPIPECWSERLVNIGKTGAIATIGNTGYGYGYLGMYCTIGGLDGYISTEFFVQYGTNGHNILGETYSHTLTEYIDHFKGSGDWDDSHQKSVEQWVLLGDPSLLIGGYS